METYRIVPRNRAFRVEVVASNGEGYLIRSWPTEEAAVSHLKALRERAEFAIRQTVPAGERDWRG